MILTDMQTNNNDIRGTWGKSSEDVRRSIDVLDKVLSEFDDIDPSSGDERNSGSLSGVGEPESETGNSSPTRPISPDNPPPIDRSLKPKISPPALPKKSRKNSFPPIDLKIQESLDSQSSRSNTHSSKKSDASSHEYQEINSDLLGPVRKNSNHRPQKEERGSERPDAGARVVYPRHRSQDPPKSGSPHFGENKMNSSSPSIGPLRKSRSGEVSLNDDNMRGRKPGRKQAPRRSRSTDRLLDPRVPTYPMPHIRPHFDPRLINPSLVDPRLMLPDFYDPRMADPRLLGARLPYRPKEFLPMPNPKFMADPRFPLDAGRHTFDDSVHFPHLLNLPHPPNGNQLPGKPLPPLHHPLSSMEYPLNIPPYDLPFMQVPPLLPEQIAALNFQMSLDPSLEGYDPRMLSYIPECPMDMPMGYDHNVPFEYPSRERLDYGGKGGPRNWESRILEDGLPISQNWPPPTPDEARKSIERIMGRNRNLCKAEEEAISGDLRNETSFQKRYPKSQQPAIGQSDSSGRSSPMDEIPRRPLPSESRARHELLDDGHGRGYHAGTVPGTRQPPGAFRVGGAVRGNTEPPRSNTAKEVMSLPHFVSGGKDSGFDESPVPDEHSSLKGPKNSAPPTGGGGFIVSGVFSDSSKMYIPCPPSPTPDYDQDLADSDDGESDILQENIYNLSEEQKRNIPIPKGPIKSTISNPSVESKSTGNSSNRNSLSEDSLQDGKKSNKMKIKSLETMMNEFHLGLPPPNQEEICYSDDSLEESSLVSPSGPSTMDLRSQRPQSMESLVSMDGSTTSFDYMSGGASKSLSPSRSKPKKKLYQQELKKDPLKNIPFNYNHKNINEYSQDISNSNYMADSIHIGPIPPPVSFDITFPSNNSKSKKKSKKMETRIYGTHGQTPDKSGKFDTIRNMIKDGLIEGLDDNPPDFKPPPPISEKPLNSNSSEERTDSGIGSTVSTNRTDESGGSDNHSDKSATPPSSQPPFSISTSISCDKNDNQRLDNSNNNNKNLSFEKRRHSPPPPPPPKRDSSMKGVPPPPANSPGGPPPHKNHSWLHKPKRQAPLPNIPQEKSSHSQRPAEPVHEIRSFIAEERPFPSPMVKANQNIGTPRGEIRTANGSIPPQDFKRRILSEKDKQENLKNLESSRIRPETLPMISEDQCSVSSHGSRSSRFFSRLSDSMKSGTRSSTSSSKGNNKNSSKQNATRHSRIHADIIRNPNLNISKSMISPPELPSVVSPSTVVPFTRDGSGRFRSIEDLAEESSFNKSLHPGAGDALLERKKKKHATLPPNLNPSTVEEEMKELRRATSLMYGKKNKDEGDSKFKFNIFKGFWRRNKYSFDKT